MKQDVMIELTENTYVLGTIKGFQWDEGYGAVSFNENRYLYRGCLYSEEAKTVIESLPSFNSLWQDSPVGFDCTIVEHENRIEGFVEETSSKEAFQLLLLYAKRKGKETSFYQKWINQMMCGKPLSRPVFGKLSRELGTQYSLERDEETLEIHNKLTLKG